MQTGRKILNLRCDRKISQQDLARACKITPSALSKIEAGINSPRANIIWRIAKNLGVTVEYLLDEEMPYPFKGYSYRYDLLRHDNNPEQMIGMKVTREEAAYLEALRRTNQVAREIAYMIPEVPVETIRLMHFLINNARIENPTHSFLRTFESLLTTGATPTAKPVADSRKRRKTSKKTPARTKSGRTSARTTSSARSGGGAGRSRSRGSRS